jgi:hypothetical protein
VLPVAIHVKKESATVMVASTAQKMSSGVVNKVRPEIKPAASFPEFKNNIRNPRMNIHSIGSRMYLLTALRFTEPKVVALRGRKSDSNNMFSAIIC